MLKQKVELALTKGMTRLGRVVEKVIGHAKSAKKQAIKPKGIQPVVSIEDQLSESKLVHVVKHSMDRLVSSTTPNLADKVALEIGESSGRYVRMLREYGASIAVQIETGDAPAGMKHPGDRRIYSVVSNVESLPIEDDFFDYAIASLTAKKQKDIVKIIKEVGRTLAAGGYAVIFDFHPFGRYAQSGEKRVKSIKSEIRGVEDYYKICRVAGLKVIEIREAFFDDSLRGLFTNDAERKIFQDVRNTPLLICLMVSKTKTAAPAA
ncbi:class I SAM-dependent methyltransferase [bacterium]|nr:class I SAM-dependent methyltransferase [bacterium]